ncbi:TPA: type 1 glutamine amidotransferase domain-containing protein, partial [Escherichia coli]
MMGTPLEILLVLTSQATMGDDPRLTGVWFEEQSTPYYALVDAGANVDIASIAGGEIPVDPHSIASEGMNPPSVECFLDDKVSMDKLEGSLKIDSIAPEGGAVMFLPGGHGTMWDLPGAGR